MRQLPIMRLEGAQGKIVQFLEYSEIWSVTDLMLSMQQLPSLHGPTGSGHFDHKISHHYVSMLFVLKMVIASAIKDARALDRYRNYH
jgi:hypothetical protein